MKTINISQNKLTKLEPYPVPNKVLNSEAKLFYFKIKKEMYLLKKLFITNKEQFSNKLFTISMLNDYQKDINIPELVIPSHFVSFKGEIIGITVPEIKNSTNVGILLHDLKVDSKEKIELLNKIGMLLKTTMSMDEFNFYFNDLHEYNFILDENQNLRAVDLDSATLNSCYALPSYYLGTVLRENFVGLNEKYTQNKDGQFYPSDDGELFSYNMMLLNTIANEKIQKVSLNDYYLYLKYLKDLGYGRHIIKIFQNLYSNAPNQNAVHYLDEIPLDNFEVSDYRIFKLRNKKDFI